MWKIVGIDFRLSPAGNQCLRRNCWNITKPWHLQQHFMQLYSSELELELTLCKWLTSGTVLVFYTWGLKYIIFFKLSCLRFGGLITSAMSEKSAPIINVHIFTIFLAQLYPPMWFKCLLSCQCHFLSRIYCRQNLANDLTASAWKIFLNEQLASLIKAPMRRSWAELVRGLKISSIFLFHKLLIKLLKIRSQIFFF